MIILKKKRVNLVIIIIINIGLLIYLAPREIQHTYNAYIFSDDGDISESIEVEIKGQTRANILYGNLLEGQLTIMNSDFFLATYGKSEKESILARFKGEKLVFTMIKLDSTNPNLRDALWASRDFNTIAGRIEGIDDLFEGKNVKFAAPAGSLEEAKEIIENLSNDE